MASLVRAGRLRSGRSPSSSCVDTRGAGRRCSRSIAAWLLAVLAFTGLCVARSMAPAFGPGDVIQDDARQHVFWMARFRDPELFRDDLIADYYQSLSPPAYSGLYWVLSRVIDPLLATKLLPPLLGTLTALFTFLLTRRLHPSPAAAFLAAILLSWYVWQHDDLVSATPRSFLTPMLAAELWAIASGRLALGATLAGLGALFYPVAAALAVALLGIRLVHLERWRPRLSRERQAWIAFLAGAALAVIGLLPGQLAASSFGPVVSADEARTMPEFGPNGREAFFFRDGYRYWIRNGRSGLGLSVTDALLDPSVPILFELAVLASLLPLLLVFGRRLPSAGHLSSRAVILVQLLVASFGLFALAHLLLFRLYLPSRYLNASLPLVLAVAAGLALGIAAEEVARRVAHPGRRGIAGLLPLAFGVSLAAYPASYDGAFRRDNQPLITAYLRSQPKDIVVAGVPLNTDPVPAFASRQVLTNREYMGSWHLGYYREMRQRTEDLIEAYYAQSPGVLVDFVARYGVDVLLVNRAAFDRTTVGEAWRSRYEPFTSIVASKFQERGAFALPQLAERCAVLDDGQVMVVPTTCIR